jgi:hypothetical protein
MVEGEASLPLPNHAPPQGRAAPVFWWNRQTASILPSNSARAPYPQSLITGLLRSIPYARPLMSALITSRASAGKGQRPLRTILDSEM